MGKIPALHWTQKNWLKYWLLKSGKANSVKHFSSDHNVVRQQHKDKLKDFNNSCL